MSSFCFIKSKRVREPSFTYFSEEYKLHGSNTNGTPQTTLESQ